MSKSIWKGNLALSALVNIPVALSIAIDKPSKGLEAKNLHKDCLTPINAPRVCVKCDKRDLQAVDLIKGYPVGAGFVTMTDSELEALKPASDKTITVTQFTKLDNIPTEYFDNAYYVVPTAAHMAFATLRDALDALDSAALAKLTLYGHEYLVALTAMDKAIILHTIREATQFRDVKGIKEYDRIPAKAPAPELAMMKEIANAMMDDFDPAAHEDSMRKGLREAIDAKASGKTPNIAAAVATTTPTINVLDALKDTLAAAKLRKSVGKMKKTPKTIPTVARKRGQKGAHA